MTGKAEAKSKNVYKIYIIIFQFLQVAKLKWDSPQKRENHEAFGTIGGREFEVPRPASSEDDDLLESRLGKYLSCGKEYCTKLMRHAFTLKIYILRIWQGQL